MRPAFIVVSCLLCLACGDDDEPAPPASDNVLVQATDESPAPAECVAFCEKANECARSEGRRLPPEVTDCERGCAAGGPHRAAPAALWACEPRPCGSEFRRCTLDAMMAHMQEQNVAAFPPICEGLCNKTAWCARQESRPPGPGEDDCPAACQPGGPYAEVGARELLCVHEPCGPIFETCRRRGGPREGTATPPAPAP